MWKEMDTMLDLRVMEESRSEWRSPIVLVPKPNRTTHFCIDFRKINTISRFDAYPMPWVEEFLDWLGGAMFLSMLNLMKGY